MKSVVTFPSRKMWLGAFTKGIFLPYEQGCVGLAGAFPVISLSSSTLQSAPETLDRS